VIKLKERALATSGATFAPWTASSLDVGPSGWPSRGLVRARMEWENPACGAVWPRKPGRVSRPRRVPRRRHGQPRHRRQYARASPTLVPRRTWGTTSPPRSRSTRNVDFFRAPCSGLGALPSAAAAACLLEAHRARGCLAVPALRRPAFPGGMKQKLGCACVPDPCPGTLLILDEPTTGVDPLSRPSILGPDSPAVAAIHTDHDPCWWQTRSMDEGRSASMSCGDGRRPRAQQRHPRRGTAPAHRRQHSGEAVFIALLPEASAGSTIPSGATAAAGDGQLAHRGH